MGDIIHFPAERGIRQFLDKLQGLSKERPIPVLLDESNGRISQEAIDDRIASLMEIHREFRERFEGEPRAYWEAHQRARCRAQAYREASQQHHAWITERKVILYTPEEHRELELLNGIMASAPISFTGNAVWTRAANRHREIRERADLRARMAVIERYCNPFPYAQEL